MAKLTSIEQPPTSSHTVPQFYLRQFLDPTRHPSAQTVWVVDLHAGAVKPQPVRQAGAIRGFYDWDKAYDWQSRGASEPNVEQLLGIFEHRTAPILKRLANGLYDLSDEDRYHLAQFLGFQFTRGEGFLESLRWTIERDKEGILQRSTASWAHVLVSNDPIIRLQARQQRRSELRSKRPIYKTPGRDALLAESLRLGHQLSRYIMGAGLGRKTTQLPTLFLTSDQPVMPLTPTGLPVPLRFDEQPRKDFALMMPLSPTALLVVGPYGDLGAKWTRFTDAAEINLRVIRMAHRYVFASHEELAQLVLKIAPQLRVDGDHPQGGLL